MNLAQLKRLAVDLRAVLSRSRIEVSHGQCLDLIAALAGLRNWPEAVAFADRLPKGSINLEAMQRLSHRIVKTRPTEEHRFVRLRLSATKLMNALAPWLLELPPPDPSRRERLIIATSDSAGGNLRRARIADHVEAGHAQLVWGPAPTDSPLPGFLDARLALWDSDLRTTDQPEAWTRESRVADDPREEWFFHIDLIAEYQRIELWVDPDPNAQLMMLQMITELSRRPGVREKLFIMHADRPIGDQGSHAMRSAELQIEKLEDGDIGLAQMAWSAWGRSTPQPWSELLKVDLRRLPHLQKAVEAMLAELPAVDTGLGATQRRMLELVAVEGTTALRLMADMHARDLTPSWCRVFGYFQLGALLDQLSRGEPRAILGLDEGPFDLQMHDDIERAKRWRASRLSLSELGRSLLDGTKDYARVAPIRHWWGGTLLTNDRLWRWDEKTRLLVHPDR